MPWSRRFFSNKNTDSPVKVWAKVDDNDEVLLEDGRVPIRYEDDEDATVYSASPDNVSSTPQENEDDSLAFLDDQYTGTRRVTDRMPAELREVDPPESDAVEIHTDGAAHKSSGSGEGPAGLGVVHALDTADGVVRG
ncbi:MAG: hypothetical protein ABEH89_01240, partial [bacterium]